MLIILVIVLIKFDLSFCSQELTLIQRRRCEQIIDVFYSNFKDVTNNYQLVQDLGDGRGFTSGRSRFTTSSGDAYQVVLRYTRLKGNNPLHKYLPILERLSDTRSNDVSELIGYSLAWKISSQDPQFEIAQDQVTELLYYKYNAF